MKRITNLSARVECLEDGTVLAASGTNGSSKEVESISEADIARLGNSVHIEDVVAAPAKSGTSNADKEKK